MKVSQYTLIFPFDGKFLILNSLTQALSIVPEPYHDLLQQMRAGVAFPDDAHHPLVDELYEQGFLVPDSTDETVFARSQMAAIRPLLSAQLRQEIVIVPTFSCNLTCAYCFQHAGRHGGEARVPANALASGDVMSGAMIDAAFDAVDAFPGAGQRVMTLFGGEPLINSPRLRAANEHICRRTRERGWDLRIYTNGIELAGSTDLVRAYRPDFQVTFHDFCDRAGDFRESPLFRKWLAGIRAAAAEGVRVTIRINVSGVDVELMPNVCRRFAQSGLFDCENIRTYFTPVLNKNFGEAGYDQGAMRVLGRLLVLRQMNPSMQAVDFIGWKVLDYFKAMGGNRDVPVPRFVRCPAMENLLCFDVSGMIYPCYELAGFPQYAVGSYYPKLVVDRKKYARWQSRTILHEEARSCGACPTATVCGGGCAADSLRRENDLHAASCEVTPAELGHFIERHPELVRRAISGKRLFD